MAAVDEQLASNASGLVPINALRGTLGLSRHSTAPRFLEADFWTGTFPDFGGLLIQKVRRSAKKPSHSLPLIVVEPDFAGSC